MRLHNKQRRNDRKAMMEMGKLEISFHAMQWLEEQELPIGLRGFSVDVRPGSQSMHEIRCVSNASTPTLCDNRGLRTGGYDSSVIWACGATSQGYIGRSVYRNKSTFAQGKNGRLCIIS